MKRNQFVVCNAGGCTEPPEGPTGYRAFNEFLNGGIREQEIAAMIGKPTDQEDQPDYTEWDAKGILTPPEVLAANARQKQEKEKPKEKKPVSNDSQDDEIASMIPNLRR